MSGEQEIGGHIAPMGEGALLVTLGDNLSLVLNSQVHALAAGLRASLEGIVRDIVPAYTSLLLTFDPDKVEREALIGATRQVMAATSNALPQPHRVVEIPVIYGGDGGPDLEAVAAFNHLAPRDVVELHSARLYHVYFLGFMPGFAYLGDLDPRIAMSRRSVPRVRIPAGSVGIAGQQTGVYPLRSPGGWQIVGRTNTVLWNAREKEPSLLLPGDSVRFVSCASFEAVEDADTYEKVAPEPDAYPAFEVIAPGAFTTVQDQGRTGYSHLGVTPGGAMDPLAADAANSLVGNAPDAAVLELTWSGPQLLALRTVAIALVGADLGCCVDGSIVPTGISWLVRAGSTVQFNMAAGKANGARAYMAINGGVAARPVLGSRSTYVAAALGGMQGRALRTGDIIHAYATRKAAGEVAGKVAGMTKATHSTPLQLRIVCYRGNGAADASITNWLLQTRFRVSEASDRMGVRLEPLTGSAPAPQARQPELLSFAVVRGAIQVPPGGVPTFLGADHQTTGGYPLAGVLAQADWPLPAALRPGDEVGFQQITLPEADQLRKASKR